MELASGGRAGPLGPPKPTRRAQRSRPTLVQIIKPIGLIEFSFIFVHESTLRRNLERLPQSKRLACVLVLGRDAEVVAMPVADRIIRRGPLAIVAAVRLPDLADDITQHLSADGNRRANSIKDDPEAAGVKTRRGSDERP